MSMKFMSPICCSGFFSWQALLWCRFYRYVTGFLLASSSS